MTHLNEVQSRPTRQVHAHSYLEWAPIFGGAVFAAAISTIMATFGSAVGLSLVSADPARSTNVTVLAIVAGLWALWIGVSASAAGCCSSPSSATDSPGSRVAARAGHDCGAEALPTASL